MHEMSFEQIFTQNPLTQSLATMTLPCVLHILQPVSLLFLLELLVSGDQISGNPNTKSQYAYGHNNGGSDTLNFRPISEYGNLSDRGLPLYWDLQRRQHFERLVSPIQLVRINSDYQFTRSQYQLLGPGSLPRRRRLFNYRPEKWQRLQIENCYTESPADLLSESKLHSYLVNPSDSSRFRTRSLRSRLQPRQIMSSMRQRGLVPDRPKGNIANVPHRNYHSNFRRAHRMTKGRSRWKSREAMYSWQRDEALVKSPVDISVHRLLIRPALLELNNGNLKGRLRYVIQLHRKLTGYYQLTVEARMDPDFPPLYIGKIHNVCAHWPSDSPQSNCSVRSNLLYQKGQICFCQMPPGVYHQRLRLNMKGLLDGLDLPRYIVNFLFKGEKLHVYINMKLENAKGEVAGCLKVKLPVMLKSA